MAPTDAELVKISWREPERFAELFDRHFLAVLGFCARRAGQAEAEDLAGETFRRAFEHRRRYDVDHPDARPWLYGIARNAVSHKLRADGRRGIALGRLGGLEALSRVDDAAGIAAAVDARRDLPVVLAALPSFPPGEVEALLLHVWEGLSYADVAVVLDVPVGTIRSRLHRLRGRLRELLPSQRDLSTDTCLPVIGERHGL